MDRTTVISSAEVQAQLAHCRAVAQLAAQWPEETRLPLWTPTAASRMRPTPSASGAI